MEVTDSKPASMLRFLPQGVLLAATMLLTAAQPASLASTTTHSNLAGTYQSETAQKGPLMSVSLGADGTATVTEDSGRGALTLFGRWVDSGGEVKVTFNAVGNEPVELPMVFQATHGGLQAASWDRAAWGKVTPPPMKKGYKVKQTYWFTTVR